jgi:ABC-type phosphate transport system auxiliary subunit
MRSLTSPGSLVTIAGAALSVIGWVGYATANPNLSLPTIFYGIPILLGGLALKSSELPPAELQAPDAAVLPLRQLPASQTLRKLVKDVTRWRYGQKAHLESSLEALKLWDEDNPPQLASVEERNEANRYGLLLRFDCQGVAYQRWQALEDRLGRFFGPGLRCSVSQPAPGQVDVMLSAAGEDG